MLKGYKTYIVAALIALLAVLKYFQIVDESMYMELLALLGAGGLAALRASKK